MSEIKKIATRESYGNALVEVGKEHEDLIVLDADLAGATKTGIFKKAFPERHWDVGIAEANMTGIAAGLATCGKVPFISSFAMFAAGRNFEQVRNSIGYPHLNVKIGAGFKEVGEGTSIDLIKVDSREYEGKTYYSAKMGNISWGDIVEPTKKPADNKYSGNASQPQRPAFNQAGIQTGHSLNCAVDFMVANNISFSQEELSELAKQFHTITEKMKVERKQRFPSLSDYDLSASTGQAVKAAASLVSKVGQVEKIALQILEVSKEIEEYIKTGGKEEEKPVVEKPKEDKPQQPEYGGGADDMDDSIPF